MKVGTKKNKNALSALMVFTILALLVIFALGNKDQTGEIINALREISFSLLAGGALLALLTFVFAAISYRFLSMTKLKIRELLLVELAAAFVNRLVPSGLGGLGVHGLYLHKRKHTVAQATTVVSVNNLLGFLTHSLLLAVVVVFIRPKFAFDLGLSQKQGWILLGIVILLALLGASRPVRSRVQHFMRDVVASLRVYSNEPQKVFAAAVMLIALTATNITILYLVAHSFDVDLGVAELFIVYSAGILLGAAVPTPGGLAGVEAGLAGGLIAYDVSSSTAIAVALTFRLLTYWLPVLPGAAALFWARKIHLL